MLYYTRTFLVGADWFGIAIPKLQTFSGIFWVLPIDCSLYEKTILRIFLYLFICKVATIKVNFRFYKQCSQAETHLVYERVSFFTSNIPLYIEKNPVEKLCKVLQMELKTCTPVSPKFVFEKMKFKFLHYIQHGFIRQRSGPSKDQVCMFRSLVINYFTLKYHHSF